MYVLTAVMNRNDWSLCEGLEAAQRQQRAALANVSLEMESANINKRPVVQHEVQVKADITAKHVKYIVILWCCGAG